MSGNAAGITDEEAMAAAKYFFLIKMTPWIKVRRTRNRPKVRNAGGLHPLWKEKQRE